MRGDVRSRFEAKVDRSAGPDGCWPWTGHRSGLRMGPVGSPLVKPQRLAWFFASGMELPANIPIGRSCTTAGCCNPAHLTPGRQSYRPTSRRLTQEDVVEIRRRYAAGETQTALSVEFGCDPSTLSLAVNGHTYRWVGQSGGAPR